MPTATPQRSASLRFCLLSLLTFHLAAASASAGTMVLPWIAQSRGALVQSSDLYLFNPGTEAMEVTLEFRKKGQPEANPPKATRTIAPDATLFIADVARTLFGAQNQAGFVVISVPGDETPVLTSFNNTFNAGGKKSGQRLAAVSSDVAETGQSQILAGLRRDARHRTTLFLFNPEERPGFYDLVLLALDGSELGRSDDIELPALGSLELDPHHLPLPAGAKPGGFTIAVVVKSGKVLSAAQVINNVTNDPAYIQGETR